VRAQARDLRRCAAGFACPRPPGGAPALSARQAAWPRSRRPRHRRRGM